MHFNEDKNEIYLEGAGIENETQLRPGKFIFLVGAVGITLADRVMQQNTYPESSKHGNFLIDLISELLDVKYKI